MLLMEFPTDAGRQPHCSRCKQAFEMVLCVPHDSEVLAALKFGDQGQHCMKPGDFDNVSVSMVLHFQSVWNTQKIEYFQSAGSLWCPPICILFSSAI